MPLITSHTAPALQRLRRSNRPCAEQQPLQRSRAGSHDAALVCYAIEMLSLDLTGRPVDSIAGLSLQHQLVVMRSSHAMSSCDCA